ncbi:LysR family transcriptional regulator [Pigmentiphaga daeguensis]
MALRNIDLHMLRILDEIHKTGSLSRTADRLELTQPAISMALAKLRQHFNDQLFVRVGNAMKPTPQAEGLMEGVSAAIAAIEMTLNYRITFEPSQTERTFRIAVSDIGQVVMVPRLLEAFSQAAPRARIEFHGINERTPQLLQTGGLDLALGYAPQISEGFFQQALFKERFVCLARSDHPRIRNRLTLSQFKNESHVVVISSISTHLIIDRALEHQHIRRNVAVRIPNLVLLAQLITGSDYLATLPARAGQAIARTAGLATYPPPFRLSGYSVTQYWHERQARDTGNRWLRNLNHQLFGGQ